MWQCRPILVLAVMVTAIILLAMPDSLAGSGIKPRIIVFSKFTIASIGMLS